MDITEKIGLDINYQRQLVNSITNAYNCQTQAERKMSWELYQLKEGVVKNLTVERYKIQHPARQGESEDNIFKWYVNIIKKYCNLKACLYVLEPERDFYFNDYGRRTIIKKDNPYYTLCNELLQSVNWSETIKEIESLIHLHNTTFVMPYLVPFKNVIDLKVIMRNEINIDPSRYNFNDIDFSNMIYFVGDTDSYNNPLYYVCYTQDSIYYLDCDRKIMDYHPISNKVYNTTNPYYQQDNYFMPIMAFHEHMPYNSLFLPLPEALHDLQLNLNSITSDTCNGILYGLFGFYFAKCFDKGEIPNHIGAGSFIQVESPNAELKSMALEPVFKDAVDSITQLLRLSLLMEDYPVSLITPMISERTANAIQAARVDLESIRIKQKPRFIKYEADLWKKVVKVYNTWVRLGFIKSIEIPENIELKVIHKVYEPKLNEQSETQAATQRIQMGVTTPIEEYASLKEIEVNDAIEKKNIINEEISNNLNAFENASEIPMVETETNIE